jgi:hypothetical protein
MAVDQPTPKSSVPDPATNIARTSGQVDGESPSMTIGTAIAAMAIMPTRNGWAYGQPQHEHRRDDRAHRLCTEGETPAVRPQSSHSAGHERSEHPEGSEVMALSNPKTTTTTHSHVREANSDQPSRSSTHIDVRSSADPASRAGKPHPPEAEDRDDVRHRVEGQRPARTDGDHEQAGDRRPDDGQPAAGERQQRIGGLQPASVDDERDDAGHGGKGERRCGAVQRLESR